MITTINLEFLLISIFEWVALASLKSIPLIIFLLALHHLFGKFFSASARHFLWLTLLISLALPFGWNVNFPALNISPTATNLADPVVNNITHDPFPSEDPINLSPASTDAFIQAANPNASSSIIPGIDPYFLLAICWLAGALVLFALTLIEVWRYHRIKKRSGSMPPAMINLFSECQSRMQLRKSVTLLCSDEIHTPIAVGWIKPSIIIPAKLANNLSNENATYILLHELGHIKRHDILINWLVSLINIAHWFNPFVWLASRHIRISMEVACDELVLRNLPRNQHTIYGETLIELCEFLNKSPRLRTAVGILENHKELLERLKMIKNLTPMNAKKQALFGGILLCTAIISFAQPATTTSTAVTQTTPAENISSTTDPHLMTLQVFIEQAERLLKTDLFVGQQHAGQTIRIKTDLASLSYSKLLSQLKVNNFTAIKSANHIEIIRLDEIRYAAVPVVEKGKTYFNDEYVTEYVPLEKSCSSGLLPALRPMIPQWSHVSITLGSLLITDSYGNIQRIKATIRAFENGKECIETSSSERSINQQ